MTPVCWKRIIVVASAGMLLELYVGFSLWFAPGWANGWPGLSMHAVWSAGMSFVLATFLITVAIGVGGVVGLTLGLRGIGLRYGLIAYSAWLLSAGTLIWFIGMSVYRDMYTDALQMWPNGYPGK